MWVVRLYVGDQQYKTETIGHADDTEDANGSDVFNFWQAQEEARKFRPGAAGVPTPSRTLSAITSSTSLKSPPTLTPSSAWLPL